MAKCPCTCGRSVPFRRGDEAKAYVRVAELARTIESITPESSPFVPSTFYDAADQFKARAAALSSWLLDHLHKTADPSATPNMTTISGEMQSLFHDVAASTRNPVNPAG